MAKASGDAYSELLIMGAVALGVYVLVKRQQTYGQAVTYDAFGNPVAGGYGSGVLSPVYGAGQSNTIPNIIGAAGNFLAELGAGGVQASLPLGDAGVSNPPPYY